MSTQQVTIKLPSRIAEGAAELAAADHRELENWIEHLVEQTVREAEPLIVGGGPSYYDGGRKRR